MLDDSALAELADLEQAVLESMLPLSVEEQKQRSEALSSRQDTLMKFLSGACTLIIPIF